jgi:RimJ/RimL family protein N-acetyltransferase
MFDLAATPVLETQRLRLRRPEERDLDALAALHADPLFMRYIANGKTMTRHETWRALAAMLGHWALRGYGLFAVEEKASGLTIGRIGLLNPEGWPGIEVAWGIARERWGQGFASEGAAAVRDYAFGTLRIPRLISLIHPDNAASAGVAVRIGERLSGSWDFDGTPIRVFAIDNPVGGGG